MLNIPEEKLISSAIYPLFPFVTTLLTQILSYIFLMCTLNIALLYRTSSPHVTVPKALPWQMKSTLIFIITLLKRHDLPRFAAFCTNPFDKRNVRLSSGHSTVCTLYSKSRQNKAKCYTQTDTNRIRISGKSIRLKLGVIVNK